MPKSRRPRKAKSSHETVIGSSNKFDLDALHSEAQKRTAKRKARAQKPENHLLSEYDVNVKESYKRSLKHAHSAEHKKHLESVLSAGPVRF